MAHDGLTADQISAKSPRIAVRKVKGVPTDEPQIKWNGRRATALRQASKLTQGAFSRRLRCSRSAIINYEHEDYADTDIEGPVTLGFDILFAELKISLEALDQLGSARKNMQKGQKPFHIGNTVKQRVREILRANGSANEEGNIQVAFIYYPASGDYLMSEDAESDKKIKEMVLAVCRSSHFKTALEEVYKYQTHFHPKEDDENAEGPGTLNAVILSFANWVLTLTLDGQGDNLRHAFIAVTEYAAEYQHAAVIQRLEKMVEEIRALT